jgi:stalled ribosome rescue protein Dom34
VREIDVIRAPDTGRGHNHHKAGTPGPGHVPTSQSFLKEIGQGLRDAQEILIVGPGDAKDSLKSFLKQQWPHVSRRIIGTEPMPKASEAEIHAFAQPIFLRADKIGSVDS